MVERGDEDPKCASLKNVLSEMVASETTEPNKDIFDVEDSLEDTDLAESECSTIVGREMENGVNCGFHHQEVGTEVSGKSTMLNLYFKVVYIYSYLALYLYCDAVQLHALKLNTGGRYPPHLVCKSPMDTPIECFHCTVNCHMQTNPLSGVVDSACLK